MQRLAHIWQIVVRMPTSQAVNPDDVTGSRHLAAKWLQEGSELIGVWMAEVD